MACVGSSRCRVRGSCTCRAGGRPKILDAGCWPAAYTGGRWVWKWAGTASGQRRRRWGSGRRWAAWERVGAEAGGAYVSGQQKSRYSGDRPWRTGPADTLARCDKPHPSVRRSIGPRSGAQPAASPDLVGARLAGAPALTLASSCCIAIMPAGLCPRPVSAWPSARRCSF